ncbi:MAG: ChaB family protein [Dehalococcoidia bacterium]
MPRRREERDGGEMPSTVARSDEHAQRIWQETHDSAVETYGEGEAAHRTAFASLKHSYKKEGDRWVRKSRRGPSDEQAARGPTTPRKSTDERTAKTAGGRVDDEEVDEAGAVRAGAAPDIVGRSKMDKEALGDRGAGARVEGVAGGSAAVR